MNSSARHAKRLLAAFARLIVRSANSPIAKGTRQPLLIGFVRVLACSDRGNNILSANAFQASSLALVHSPWPTESSEIIAQTTGSGNGQKSVNRLRCGSGVPKIGVNLRESVSPEGAIHGISHPRPHGRPGLQPVLRHDVVRRRRGRDDRRGHVQPLPRGRHQLLRLRQRLQQGPLRGDPRPPDCGGGLSGRGRHHVESQLPDDARSQRPRLIAAPHHAPGGGQPQAPGHRLDRPLLPARLGREDADG